MARKVNTSKEKRRSKRKDRVDYTSTTMAAIKELERQERIMSAFEASINANPDLLRKLVD